MGGGSCIGGRATGKYCFHKELSIASGVYEPVGGKRLPRPAGKAKRRGAEPLEGMLPEMIAFIRLCLIRVLFLRLLAGNRFPRPAGKARRRGAGPLERYDDGNCCFHNKPLKAG